MRRVERKVGGTEFAVPPASSPESAVLVVVLRLGSPALSPELLESLSVLRQNYPVHSVVVVENADGRPAEPLDEPGVDATIRLSFNRGYAVAMNTAARSVDPDRFFCLLFITDDAVVSAGSLDRLLRPLSDDHIAITAPAIFTDGELRIGGTWNSTFGWSRHIVAQHGEIDRTKTPVWADGACLAIKQHLFAELGGFDERTFLYVEDVQLGVRATLLGKRVAIIPEVVITQKSGMRNRSGAHGYLLIRNEMLSLRTMGHSVLPAAAVGTSRAALEVARSALTTGRRIHHLRQAVGMTWGVFHGLIRRSGPPPRLLAKWATIPAIEHDRVVRS